MADEEKTKKKGGKLKWLLLFFFILLLAGGGAGAWYYFFSGLPGSKGASAQQDGSAKATPQAPVQDLTSTVLPSFLVNLADPLGRRYIKLTVEVEVSNPEVIQEITRQMPKIRDAVIMLLSSKTYADLMPTESKIVLKNELASRLNQVLGGPKVTRVFFTDMVIQ